MRLIDLDATVIVPIQDERYDTTYEVQMTVEEIFDKFLDGNKPEVIEAIPVKWIKAMENATTNSIEYMGLNAVLTLWKAEQEVVNETSGEV